MSATKLNAEAIRDLLNRTDRHLLNALVDLTAAVERANNDYDHNGDRLTSALGALRLVAAVVGAEHCTWGDYARNRRAAARSGVGVTAAGFGDNTMSDVVERAKAALEGVSDGPWRWEPSKYIRTGYVITAANRTAVHATEWGELAANEKFNHQDASFAAAARTLVPELVAEVERLEGRVAALKVGQGNLQVLLADAHAEVERLRSSSGVGVQEAHQ